MTANCEHDIEIKIDETNIREHDPPITTMIELECKKCRDYFVMTKENFYKVLSLQERIKKELILKNLE